MFVIRKGAIIPHPSEPRKTATITGIKDGMIGWRCRDGMFGTMPIESLIHILRHHIQK